MGVTIKKLTVYIFGVPFVVITTEEKDTETPTVGFKNE